MTTLADKIEALAKDVGDPETVARMLRGVGIFPGTAVFVEEIPTILRALRERDQAVETLLDVGASLAAAISLLERSRKSAMKAAPSNLMFDQMLADYRASLSRARTTFASIEGAGHE